MLNEPVSREQPIAVWAIEHGVPASFTFSQAMLALTTRGFPPSPLPEIAAFRQRSRNCGDLGLAANRERRGHGPEQQGIGFHLNPEGAVERAILDRFAHVLGRDRFRAFEIGDRARDL